MTKSTLFSKWAVLTLSLLSLVEITGNSQTITDESKPKIMVLGSFHFNYPNLDIVKTEEKDQIDITSGNAQKEIREVIENFKIFSPNKIAIEISISDQSRIDSLYQDYLSDKFELPRSESFQLGFRLAKELGHEKIYCIDEWGNISYFYKSEDNINFQERPELKESLEKFETYTDSLLAAGQFRKNIFPIEIASERKTIREILSFLNQPDFMRNEHARYLHNNFLFEAKPGDYIGVDFIALSWYSRNLRIFRNIQRITEGSGDRILIIYGSGHGYLLNQFINESGQYENTSPLTFLK